MYRKRKYQKLVDLGKTKADFTRLVVSIACGFLLLGTDNPSSNPTPIHDTQLDISGSLVSVTLLACDAGTRDQVLVDGRPPDHVVWDNPIVDPAKDTPDVGIYAKVRRPLLSISSVVNFRIESGFQMVYLAVGHCETSPVALIASESFNRTISLKTKIASTSLVAAAAKPTVAGLCGRIPLGDLQVTLVSVDSDVSYIGQNASGRYSDDFGYFIDDARPGRYRLIVRGFDWDVDLGSVNLATPGLYTRDISADDLDLYPVVKSISTVPNAVYHGREGQSVLRGPIVSTSC